MCCLGICSLWHWLRSLGGIQLAGKLIWRVPAGFAHMPGVWVRMAGRLDSSEAVSLHMAP